tara:strand:- start:1230 stop:1751 length:522 start_codon:yes stop_codon:yes gene_type:complete
MNLHTVYETERLLLMPTSVQDTSFILELLNTPKWLQFIGDRNVKTLAAAEVYIHTKILPQYEKNGFGNYTVSLKENSIKIGSCGLYDREGIDGIDIGFAFLPKYEKQGYAFESVSKIKEIAIKKFKLDKLSAITDKRNLDSQSLLEKLDLKFSNFIVLPKSDEELMLYKWNSK